MKRLSIFKINNICLYALVLFFPLALFQLWRRPLYIWLELLFIVICTCTIKIVLLNKSIIINIMFLSIILSAFSAYMSDMRDTYIKAAVVAAIYAIMMYIVILYVRYLMQKNAIPVLEVIIRAFKVMCITQVLWIPIQFLAYHVFSTDLNQLIFVDTLKMVKNASFLRSWIWYPSGLSWHSAILAPMFVLGLLVFKQPYIRFLLIIDALICGNSTSIIGVMLTLVLMFFFGREERKMKISIRYILVSIFSLTIFILLAHRFGFFEKVSAQITYLYIRLFGEEIDASTAAHFGYFHDYIDIVKNSSFFQVLFGYGEGCSGYPITIMYNRYTSIDSWAIECDIIDKLISRGLFGFIAFYTMPIYVGLKGWKLDRRYFIAVFVILVEGFGYNVQWDYVVFLELVLMLTIEFRINFFCIADNCPVFKMRGAKNGTIQIFNNSTNI